MAYADYTFYKDTYHGVAIPEADFPRLAQRASEQVDFLTRYRAAVYADSVDPEPIAKAACAIAEVLWQGERGGASSGTAGSEKVIKSESVGKQKVDYATFHAASAAGQSYLNRQMAKAAALHLFPTGLLYRGAVTC